MTQEAIELVAARFRALGDPSRLRLLDLLMAGDRSVQELVEASNLTQANVSRHLGLLRREGLVSRTREGNKAVYQISDPTLVRLCALVCGGISEQLAGGLDALQGE